MEPKQADKRRESTGVVFLAIAILLSIAYYIPSAATGPLGLFCLRLGRGLFGLIAYILPALFFYGTVEFLRGKASPTGPRRFLHATLILLLLAALIQLYGLSYNELKALSETAGQPAKASRSLSLLWQVSIDPAAVADLEVRLTGGLLGGLLAYSLASITGKVGATIVLLAAILIECVILLDLSPSHLVRRTEEAARRAGQKIRSDRRNRRLEEQETLPVGRGQAGPVMTTGQPQSRVKPKDFEPDLREILGEALPDREHFFNREYSEDSQSPESGLKSDQGSHFLTASGQANAVPQAEKPDILSNFSYYHYSDGQVTSEQVFATDEGGETESAPGRKSPQILSWEEVKAEAEVAEQETSGDASGFFQVGETCQEGAVKVDPNLLNGVEGNDDFSFRENKQPDGTVDRKGLFSTAPLFSFDADALPAPPIIGDQPANPESNDLFAVPDFLKKDDAQADEAEASAFIDVNFDRKPADSVIDQPVNDNAGVPHFAKFEESDLPFEEENAQSKQTDFAPDESYVIPEETDLSSEAPPPVVNDLTGEALGQVLAKPKKDQVTPVSSVLQPTRQGQSAAAEAAALKEAKLRRREREKERNKKNHHRPYVFPTTDLLKPDAGNLKGQSRATVEGLAHRLEETLHNFGVEAKVVNVTTGPAITRFELVPGLGVKVSRIVNLADDIALSLAATGLRIEAPIPGKSAIGIEIPNVQTQTVYLRSLLESREFKAAKSKLSVVLGRDIPGAPVLCDLTKMPHLLIAGATGSGKSVCVNSILMSVLFKASPEAVRLILIDPKIVELSVYNGIPHLLTPVVTDPKKAANSLNWAVVEMDRRYGIFAEYHVRDVKAYNQYLANNPKAAEKLEPMPLILVVIDELADLMMTAPADVEDAIVRLTQKARAAGIHLIIATQRPSVDVITGLIKANIPSRIAFAVSSQVDSRTILDTGGAEKLLGKGDMLYNPQSSNKPIRSQGALVTDTEVEQVLDFVRSHNEDRYDEKLADAVVTAPSKGSGVESEQGEGDELIPEAFDLFMEMGQASISLLQRRLKIGYPRASRIIDELEMLGWIGPFEGSKPRTIKLTPAEWEAIRSGREEEST